MARQVTGTQGILKAARVICRLVNRFGTAKLAAMTSAEFAAAASALAGACMLLEATDNFIAVIDRQTGDTGTGAYNEDLPLGATATLANENAEAVNE